MGISSQAPQPLRKAKRAAVSPDDRTRPRSAPVAVDRRAGRLRVARIDDAYTRPVAPTDVMTTKLRGFGTTIFAEMSALAVETGAIKEKDLVGHIEPAGDGEDTGADPADPEDPQLERALDLLKTWNVFSQFQGADDGSDQGLGVAAVTGDDAPASE